MPTPAELPSLEDALGAAAVEHGFGDDPEDQIVFEAEPPADTAPPSSVEEQITQVDQAPVDTDDSVFAELPEETAAPAQTGVDLDTPIVVPGIDRPVPIAELRDGYLRQADYTKKTQALAAERKAFAEQSEGALKLLENLRADPAGTAAYLAVKTGVVTEEQVAGKVRQMQGAWKPPPTPEEVEAEVERRVAERVQQHPQVIEATAQAIQQRVNDDFSRIEQKHQIKLTGKDRMAVLQRAVKAGTGDLDLVVQGMLRQLEQTRQAREQARGAAGVRPSVRPSSDAPAKVASVEDAFALALSQLGGKGG